MARPILPPLLASAGIERLAHHVYIIMAVVTGSKFTSLTETRTLVPAKHSAVRVVITCSNNTWKPRQRVGQCDYAN